MSLIEAIILGIIQGATEFLPISSSGHLVLVPAILKWSPASLSLVAIVHQGTLVAVLVYFWQDLWRVMTAVIQGIRKRQPLATAESRLGWFIALGSIPAGIVGLALESFFEEAFGTPKIAAAFLLLTAVLLIVGERLLSGKKTIAQITWLDALIVGLFQTLALFPGVSRSGSTITAGLWRGLDRAAAARFSFLLGIPAILGAGLLSGLDIIRTDDLAVQLPLMIGGFLAAAISGYFCIHFLLTWLRRHSLYPFAIYCATFGILYLVFAP